MKKNTTAQCIRHLALILFLITLPCTAFAQIDDEPEVTPNQGEEEVPAEMETADSGTPSILVVTFGPLGILNMQKNSAPSPILFSIGAGAQIKLAKYISFTPHGQFFGTYYLWENEQALPAEIENRTAYVPSIMVDIPLTLDIYLGNSIFRIGASPSVLLRFAVRATSVPVSEKSDITEMNKWFWQNGRFFYPSAQFSWDTVLDNGMAFGIGIKTYFPLGEFLDGKGLDKGMVNLSVRFIPPVW